MVTNIEGGMSRHSEALSPREHFRGLGQAAGDLAKQGPHHHHEERGGNPLPRHVADGHGDALAHGQDVEEVTAHHGRRA
jgi:hypothetical protein